MTNRFHGRTGSARACPGKSPINYYPPPSHQTGDGRPRVSVQSPRLALLTSVLFHIYLSYLFFFYRTIDRASFVFFFSSSRKGENGILLRSFVVNYWKKKKKKRKQIMDTVEKRSCPFLSKNKFVKCLVFPFFFFFELSVCLLSRVGSVSNARCKEEEKI